MRTLIFALAGFIGAVGLVLSLLLFARLSARLRWRWLSFVVPLILLTAGLATLMSGRDLNMPIDFETGTAARGALQAWVQRLASLVLLAGCFDQALAAWQRRRGAGAAGRGAAGAGHVGTGPAGSRYAGSARLAWPLLLAYGAFWLTSVALPALLGAEPRLTHDNLYAALIGAALLLSSAEDADRLWRITRDSLLVFLLLGLLLIPVVPALMIESNYSQGLIPGLPRMAGLSPHAISLAMLALVGMLCQLAHPYRSRGWNLAAWCLLGLVLLLAQSKSIWIATMLCLGTMMVVRKRPAMLHWATDPGSRSSIVLAIGVVMVLVLLVGLAITAGGLAGQLMDFLSSSQGKEAMTMTGRDVIWQAALDEWKRHPIFGYGPAMFGPDYREYIDMPFATHGHNQFVDSLARTGLVGTTVLTIYLLLLTVESLRLAERSGGLTIALWLLLMMRSISEVPFDLYSYGPEIVPHFLLLATIAGCRAAQPRAASANHDASAARNASAARDDSAAREAGMAAAAITRLQ